MADKLDDDTPAFGGLLRELRTASGFTQEQLAESAGLGIRTIGELERGRVRRPHRQSVALLAAALGLTPAAREQLARAAGQRPASAGGAAGTGGPVIPGHGSADLARSQRPLSSLHSVPEM